MVGNGVCLRSTFDLALGHCHNKFPRFSLMFFFWLNKKAVCNTHAFYLAGNLTCLPYEKNTVIIREFLNINGILKVTVIATKWHKKLDCGPTPFSTEPPYLVSITWQYSIFMQVRARPDKVKTWTLLSCIEKCLRHTIQTYHKIVQNGYSFPSLRPWDMESMRIWRKKCRFSLPWREFSNR